MRIVEVSLGRINRDLAQHRPSIEQGKRIAIITRGGKATYQVTSGVNAKLPTKIKRMGIKSFRDHPGLILETLLTGANQAIVLTCHGRDSMQIQLINGLSMNLN